METSETNKTLSLVRPIFHGTAGGYFSIWIVNTLFTIFSLGIYGPWAKVRTLKYFYGSTELSGSRFDFHGNPIAILKGRVIAAFLGFLYFGGAYITPYLTILGALLLFFAIPWIFTKSLRFRLGYTSYRNIRFSFKGKIKEAYAIWFKYITPVAICSVILIFLSAYYGLEDKNALKGEGMIPVMFAILGLVVVQLAYMSFVFHRFYNAVFHFLYDNTYYGTAKASINSDHHDVFHKIMLPPTIIAIGGIVVSFFSIFALSMLGLSSLMVLPVLFVYLTFFASFVYFKYSLIHYIWSRLKLAEYPSISWLQFTEFFKIALTNTLAVALSLGLAYPWAKIRYRKYVIENRGIRIDNFDSFFAANEETLSAVGDEVSSAFDFDFEMGL